MSTIQILLPVHNEAASIEKVIREINDQISKIVKIKFIVSEDGSKDDTVKIVKRLAKKYPIKFITSSRRKGYARAVIDGFKKTNQKYLLCLDSDGQCDPKDFLPFYKKINDYDMVIGWRKQRADGFQRRLLSNSFKLIYRRLFNVKIHDPSCPFILVRKKVIDKLINDFGTLREGFWWEFVARVNLAGFSIVEIPVHHRQRLDGDTRVYSLNKLPGIAYTHIIGIAKMFWELQIRKH